MTEIWPEYNWNAGLSKAAALGGQVFLLRFLRAAVPQSLWDSLTYAAGAAAGNLEALEYLRSYSPSCPIDAKACRKQLKRPTMADRAKSTVCTGRLVIQLRNAKWALESAEVLELKLVRGE